MAAQRLHLLGFGTAIGILNRFGTSYKRHISSDAHLGVGTT